MNYDGQFSAVVTIQFAVVFMVTITYKLVVID